MANELTLSGESESASMPTLIRTYGEFWDPELVNWDRAWSLWGKKSQTSRSAPINVYEERGVYVLYKDYQPVYVGKADSQSIGYRLQLHRQSHSKGPRWNQFSWFGIRGLTPKNKLKASLVTLDSGLEMNHELIHFLQEKPEIEVQVTCV